MSWVLPDPHEDITVVAGGIPYEGWESVQIEWAMPNIEVTALVTTTEVGPFSEAPVFDEWNFAPGVAIDIYASGTIVFSGVVYSYMPSADAEQHSITLVCKTLSRDWAVSSVRSDTGAYYNTTDVDIIAQTAAAHGIWFKNHTTPEPVPWFMIKQGATNYAEMMRLVQDNGKMIMAMNTGELALVGGIPFRMSGSLVQGANIKSMSAKLTDLEFTEHEVIGQSNIETNLQNNLQVHASAYNQKGRSKYRRIVDQRASNVMQALARANWERNRNVGEAIQATIVSPGWRDSEGAFWMANQDVYVYAPWLQIDCVLRVQRVVFTQNLSLGTVAELTLLDPRAVIGSDAPEFTACNSGMVWDLGFRSADMLNDLGVPPYEPGGILPPLPSFVPDGSQPAMTQVWNAVAARYNWYVNRR